MTYLLFLLSPPFPHCPPTYTPTPDPSSLGVTVGASPSPLGLLVLAMCVLGLALWIALLNVARRGKR